MIQAIGLTGEPGDHGPGVDDLTFQALPGQVTVLFGESGVGKTHAVRLMLQVAPGRGTALFRGRPLRRIPHPAREVGVVLGGAVGHPRRTLRGHLRMLAPAVGVPTSRAEDVLDVVGLAEVADQRLGRCSRGMERRLALAAALLGDPHTLVLDTPLRDLSEREKAWLRGLLRGFAQSGGTVFVTLDDAQEAAAVADRVVTLGGGRLLADQPVTDFVRTRLRSRVSVWSPEADRLAVVLAGESPAAATSHGDAAQPLTVVRQGSGGLEVYGGSCVMVGEAAHRHGIPIHRLEAGAAAEAADPAPGAGASRGVTDPTAVAGGASGARAVSSLGLVPRPSRPVRYEVRRLATVPTGWLIGLAAVFGTWLAACVLARRGEVPTPQVVAGWHEMLPLPPVALAAGLLGASAFRDEHRYPALHPAYTGLRRRPPLVAAKLLVNGLLVVLLCLVCLSGAASLAALLPGSGSVAVASVSGVRAVTGIVVLAVGCCWFGLVSAALFRSVAAGLLGVLAVPAVVVPVVRSLTAGSAGPDGGLGQWLTAPVVPPWAEDPSSGVLLAGPVGQAVILSSAVLLCACGLAVGRRRPRRSADPTADLTTRQRQASPQLRAAHGRSVPDVAPRAQAVR